MMNTHLKRNPLKACLWQTSFAALIYCLVTFPATANPEGGSVVRGEADISSSATTTTITQSSDRAVINWKNFSIDKGETTQFVQPGSSSITLNRVTGDEISKIFGTLNANGRVMLLNPNGVLFGPSA